MHDEPSQYYLRSGETVNTSDVNTNHVLATAETLAYYVTQYNLRTGKHLEEEATDTVPDIVLRVQLTEPGSCVILVQYATVDHANCVAITMNVSLSLDLIQKIEEAATAAVEKAAA